MDKMNTHEQISALVDGQLRGEDLACALDAATSDPAAQQAWHSYHLIGDVLRSQELAAATPADRFLARLQASLPAQQVLPQGARRPPSSGTRAQPDLRQTAANDGWPWKMAAGFAALTAAAAVTWSMLAGSADRGASPQLASLPAAPAAGVVLAASSAGPMIRDERLDRLLAAHRQFGGATALQTPAPFVRNAAFEAPAR